MGRFGLTYEDTKTLTIHEFYMYSLANQIKRQEEREQASYQAWQNQSARATKVSGKKEVSAYRSFKDFYDSVKDYESIFYGQATPKRELTLADINRAINN